MAAVTMCSDFGAQENSQPLFPLFPYLFSMKWWDQITMIIVFWILSFKPTFSLSSFTFIKRLFSSSWLSAIRVVSSAYLILLILLPAVLIPACASSMYSLGQNNGVVIRSLLQRILPTQVSHIAGEFFTS